MNRPNRPRKLPTLDTFIQQQVAAQMGARNAYVSAFGFHTMYVRMSNRYINGKRLWPTLDLANMTAKKPGSGVFTRLIARLREEYPTLNIYVEQVMLERFAAKLLQLGFIKLDPKMHGESYFLIAAKEPHVS